MRQSDYSHSSTAAVSLAECKRGLDSEARRSARRPFDFWSLGLGVACLFLGLQAFLVNAQDKTAAATAPAGNDLHTEMLVRLTFVDKRELTFDRAGVLEFVQEDGVSVEAGQVVARFLNSREKAGVVVAQARAMNNAEVLEAKAQADLAQIKAKASQGVYDKKKAENGLEVFEKSYLEELWKAHEAAVAAIGRAEKEHAVNEKGIEQAQADLQMTEIKAPLAGQVSRVYKRSGEGVQAGEKVLQLISMQRIRASVEVPVTLLPRLKVGMPVTIIVDHANQAGVIQPHRYPTTLKWIDPSVIPGGKKLTVWTEIDNTGGQLREGMISSMELALEKPVVPQPAAAAK